MIFSACLVMGNDINIGTEVKGVGQVEVIKRDGSLVN